MLSDVSTARTSDLTTIQLLESYWRIHWASFAPNHRSKTRGRLILMAASLLTDHRDGTKVLSEVKGHNVPYRTARPEPTSCEAWVARYLLDWFLPAPEYTRSTTVLPDSSEVILAAAWVNERSKPARSITDEDLVKLRSDLGGKAYETRRTYWSSVEAVIHWALLVGHLEPSWV
jgi:hypothetical protein